MNVRRVPEMGLVVQEADDDQVQMLRHLPLLADAGGNPLAERRLFPGLFAQPDSSDQFEANRDWEEMVSSDLRRRFAADLETVVADMEKAYPSPEGGWDFLIRFEHVPAWFSGLNQARLVMSQRHQFPDLKDEAATVEFLQSSEGPMLAAEQFFAFLQSALLALEMDREGEDEEPGADDDGDVVEPLL